MTSARISHNAYDFWLLSMSIFVIIFVHFIIRTWMHSAWFFFVCCFAHTMTIRTGRHAYSLARQFIQLDGDMHFNNLHLWYESACSVHIYCVYFFICKIYVRSSDWWCFVRLLVCLIIHYFVNFVWNLLTKKIVNKPKHFVQLILFSIVVWKTNTL